MPLLSRSGLVATALAVLALAAPNALAVRYYAQPASAPIAATSTSPTSPVNSGARFVCTPRGVAICTPRSTTHASTASGSHGFAYGDAAIGAALIAGLVSLGMASMLAVRRRRQPLHP